MGQTTIKFNLSKKPEKELFIDFEGKQINNVQINGKPSAQNSYDGFRILLDSNLLQVKENTVLITFLNGYRNDGDGLHSFVDQTDGQQYLYTHLEPDYCHYVMPIFDQPDLRATWTLTTMHPQDWNVVSNERDAPA